MAVGTN